MKHPKILKYLTVAIYLIAAPLAAATIKIGSIAPERSPWDKTLNQIAIEWAKITGGEVQLKIYPGGITGGELDMQRKMRVGTLGGGVFTNMGIMKIEHDVLVLNTPFLFDSEPEFNFVFDKIRPIFEKKLEERGFKVIIWTMAGWVHFFSKDKVINPEEMKKYKISFTTGEPEFEQAWKKMGFQVVPQELNDVLMALQSGMVTAFYLPPLFAGSGQYFALAPHMLDLKMAPLVGGLVISDRIWKSIPERFHQPMLTAAEKAANNLYAKTMELERETLKVMVENGLKIHSPAPDTLAKWRTISQTGMEELIGKAFSREIYDQIHAYLNDYRKKSDQ